MDLPDHRMVKAGGGDAFDVKIRLLYQRQKYIVCYVHVFFRGMLS